MMKIFIDYDIHPDLGGQQVIKDEYNNEIPHSHIVGKKILNVEYEEYHIILTLSNESVE